MPKGPKPAGLRLSEEERTGLEALVRRHSTPHQLAQRGKMILGAAEGKRNAQIARELGACVYTVRKWRMHWIGLQAVSLADHGRANLSDDRAGLRATQRTSHQ